jgi:hypothetical protein
MKEDRAIAIFNSHLFLTTFIFSVSRFLLEIPDFFICRKKIGGKYGTTY